MDFTPKPKVSEVNATQIDEWKEKHGEIKQYDIPVDDTDDGEKASFIIRKPTRSVMAAVAKYVQDKNTPKAEQTMVNSCVLAGDIELLGKNDEVYYSLLSKLGDEIVIRQAEVKKL